MSSMRNAVQRRNHKERSQPKGREKWGLLEKHKDYSLRAADYNTKKRKLSILSQKARERHPDEFAFGMLSAEKSKQGKHGQNSQENRLEHDTVKLLKSQDQGYLRTVGQKGRREVEELQRAVEMGKVVEGLAIAGEEDDESGISRGVGGKKILFVDADEDVANTTSKSPKIQTNTSAETDPDLIDSEDEDPITTSTSHPPTSTTNPTTKRTTTQPQSKLRALRKRRKRLQDLQAAKLQALKVRQKEIMAAAEVLESQRAKMARTVGGVNRDGVAFRIKERKR